jgi:20S proteasome alpha/beta subunit
MTVAAGFVCQDGIVICADSQESAGDYKFPVEKVLTRIDPWTEIAIAGSGFGPLVDMASQKIADRLMGGWDEYSIVQQRIEETLNELYERPFHFYPVATPDDTTVDLLIAVRLRKHHFPRLYHSSATAVVRVPEYAIIGSGRAVQYEVQNLYGKYMSVQRGILLAVQLLYIAKTVLRSVGGTGKIVTLGGTGLAIGEAGAWEINESEKALKHFTSFTSTLLLNYMDLGFSDAEFAENLKNFAEHLYRTRSEYRASYGQWKAFMDALSHPVPLEKPSEKQAEDQKKEQDEKREKPS